MAEKKDQPPIEQVGRPSEDRVAAPVTTERLNPLEMDGKGQQLPEAERLRAEHAAALAETRRKGDEATKAAEMELLTAQREAVAAEQDRRREQALKEAEAQRQGFVEQRGRLQPLSVDPATLALEAALNASMAAALEQDETVPGGAYIVGDRFVDADGRDLGPAKG